MDHGMNSQDEANQRVYHAFGVDREYGRWELSRCEATTLLKYQSTFAGRDVLDVGVGTGRTTFYIAPLARRYEAIDYSPVMVERVKTTMPAISVRLSDFRDLSAFSDASIDMIFATNNVYDAVSHEDRTRSLAEAHRVLRPGGHLMFTSHNRRYRHARRRPVLARSRNPVTQAAHVVTWMRSIANQLRNRHLERVEADYAILTDEGHDYQCLHYYVDPLVQRRRLAELGYRVVDVLDHVGRSVAETDACITSPWLMYVASRE